MWLTRPDPTQRQPNEDAVEWARKETWVLTVWKCKVYGLLLGVNLLLVVLISKGMPGPILWRWLSIPLVLVLAYLFAAFAFYSATAISEFLDRSRN